MLRSNNSQRNSLVLVPKNQFQEIISKRYSLSLPQNNKESIKKNLSLRLSSFHPQNNQSQVINETNVVTSKKLKPCMRIPQRLLQKSKQYYRQDAKQVLKLNFAKNFIQPVLQDKIPKIRLSLHQSQIKKYNSHTQKSNNKPIKLITGNGLINSKNKQNQHVYLQLRQKDLKAKLKSYISKLKLTLQGKNKLNDSFQKEQRNATFVPKTSNFHKTFQSLSKNFKNLLEFNQKYSNLPLQKVQSLQKKVPYSILKQEYKCLNTSNNCPVVTNRLLRVFGINKENLYSFVNQQQFFKFMKIVNKKVNRTQIKQFFYKYFFLDESVIQKNSFFTILSYILSKLQPVINPNTINIIFQQFMSLINLRLNQFDANKQNRIKSQQNKARNQQNKAQNQSNKIQNKQNRIQNIQKFTISKIQFKQILLNDPNFIWDLILELIFMA